MKTFQKLAVCFAIAVTLGYSTIAEANLENRPASVQAQAPLKDVAMTLVFSDKVNLPATAVKISDAKGNSVHTGTLRYGSDDRNVEIPLGGALRPGVYSISWHAVSVDGQEDVGGYDFTIDAVGRQVPSVAQN